MRLNFYDSVLLPLCDAFGQSLYSYIDICLVHYHELRIDLKHHSSCLLEDLVSELKVIILVHEHIEW
jgi:hypothetical protein